MEICQPTEMKSWKRCFPTMDLQRKPKLVKMYQQLWMPKNAELNATLLKSWLLEIITLWATLLNYGKCSLPIIAMESKISLSFVKSHFYCQPIQGCERGFDAQNRINNALRNRFKAERLDVLTTIDIEGPPFKDFGFSTALDVWVRTNRRISTCASTSN